MIQSPECSSSGEDESVIDEKVYCVVSPGPEVVVSDSYSDSD